MSTLHIRELRRAVQQCFFGFASAIPDDPNHTTAARDFVHDAFVELDLTVVGEQGEPVDDVETVVRDALDDVENFSLVPPEE